MVRYVYKCTNKQCDNIEEREFPMGKAPEEADICLDCAAGALIRAYVPVAVSFKGSGFYRTDNPKTKHVSTQMEVI